MNKMKTLPKLHLCCSDDELRPVMNHVFVSKEDIVSSDSHMLIKFNTEEIFDPDFIEAMPKRFLIHGENWKMMAKRHDFIFFKDDRIEVIKNDYSILIPIVLEDKIGKYPDYKLVMGKLEKTPIEKIGIKPELLKKLSLAIGSKILQLYFNDNSHRIDIKAPGIKGFEALIMPAMIDD